MLLAIYSLERPTALSSTDRGLYHLPLCRAETGAAERARVSNPGSTGDIMSNLGVFGWIRESVKRSVLLGFSDAVEQLGSAADPSDPIHPQLASVLRQAAQPLALAEPTERRPGKSERKRIIARRANRGWGKCMGRRAIGSRRSSKTRSSSRCGRMRIRSCSRS